MEAQHRDSDIATLLADIETLGKQAARPPDTPLSDDARDALGRVYTRFVRRVYCFCLKRIRFLLPQECLLDEFVETVFFRLVRSAHRITLRNTHPLADVEAQLLACLHGHALWAMRDALEKSKKVEQHADAIMRDIGTPRSDTDLPTTPTVAANRGRLRAELQRMGDRACDVLFTSYDHQDLVTREFRLPDEVRYALCKRCNFKTPNALAQYRLRRIVELRSRLSSVA
jgi:hypothetical protein